MKDQRRRLSGREWGAVGHDVAGAVPLHRVAEGAWLRGWVVRLTVCGTPSIGRAVFVAVGGPAAFNSSAGLRKCGLRNRPGPSTCPGMNARDDRIAALSDRAEMLGRAIEAESWRRATLKGSKAGVRAPARRSGPRSDRPGKFGRI